VKQAVILHAMGQTSKGHWYPWLEKELEQRGYEVWAPDMPSPDMPNARQTTEALLMMLANKDWDIDENVVFIGHSWGAVQVLHLLQNLPPNTKVNAAVLISAFDHPAIGMEKEHAGLFQEPYDFATIKQRAKQFVFLHGSDDPWVPLEGSKNLAAQTGGTLEIVLGGQHFSTSLDPTYKEFPKLIEILEAQNILT